MQGKPILTIDRFSGTGEGGILYLEGFVPDVENGQSVLREGLATNKGGEGVDTGDSGFSALLNVQKIKYVQALNGSSIYKIIYDSLGQFFIKNVLNTTFTNGYIFTSPSTGNYTALTKSDIYELPSGNLLWNTNISTGLIIRGKVKTGSSTTKIVDTDGRDFSAMGVTTANTVVNIVTGKTYPITSITTTTATNDTLNFSAIGGSANTANDEFLVFVHQKFDLNGSLAIPTFKGQPLQTYWSRQIRQFGDVFYILNGNYLAKLAADETTFEAGFKRLSSGFQATCFDVNTDRILVAARSVSQGFRLFLWNGYSDGWNNILRVDSEINAITNYKNGWVYIINGVLYFTDGYQIQELSSYNDRLMIQGNSSQPNNFNGIATIDDTVFSYFQTKNNNRVWNAIYIWNSKTGWTIVPATLSGRLFGTVTCIEPKHYATSSSSSFPSTIDVGMTSGVSSLVDNLGNTSQYLNRVATFFIRLPAKLQVKAIELNISYNYDLAGDISSYNQAKLSVNIGEGRGGLFNIVQATTVPSTTSVVVDGTVRPGIVGDEVQFVPGSSSNALNGERTFITSIANAGLSNETWTVSPAVSSAVGTTHLMRIIKVRSMTPVSKTVGYDDLNEPLVFNVNKGFVSDKLFIEVVTTGVTNGFPICINSIKVY